MEIALKEEYRQWDTTLALASPQYLKALATESFKQEGNDLNNIRRFLRLFSFYAERCV